MPLTSSLSQLRPLTQPSIAGPNSIPHPQQFAASVQQPATVTGPAGTGAFHRTFQGRIRSRSFSTSTT